MPTGFDSRHVLLPHPVSERGTSQGLVQEFEVGVSHRPQQQLTLAYRLTGELYALRLPEQRPTTSVDVWARSRKTCQRMAGSESRSQSNTL